MDNSRIDKWREKDEINNLVHIVLSDELAVSTIATLMKL